jgi:L-fuconolactonase
MNVDAHQHYWHPGREIMVGCRRATRWLDRSLRPGRSGAGARRHGSRRPCWSRPRQAWRRRSICSAADANAQRGGRRRLASILEDPTSQPSSRASPGNPVFKGVRPMIQDIPDLDWMLRPDIAWAFEALSLARSQPLTPRLPGASAALRHLPVAGIQSCAWSSTMA